MTPLRRLTSTMRLIVLVACVCVSVLLAFPSPTSAGTLDRALDLKQSPRLSCVVSTILIVRYDSGRESYNRSSAPCATRARSAPAGNFGYFTFTPSDPNFFGYSRNGSVSAQVTYRGAYPVAFGFNISPHLYALAASPGTANVTEYINNTTPTGCKYHKVKPISYPWHWSCPGHFPQADYTIAGNFVFRTNPPGTALLQMVFRFSIAR